jgi:hypothetical protein
MPTPTKLASPRIEVLLEGRDEAVTVQTRNPDLVLWDRTRAKHHWPKLDEAPFLWLTFLAWSAMRRAGDIPADMSYEKFEASTLDVAAQNDDDESEEGAPFPPSESSAAYL